MKPEIRKIQKTGKGRSYALNLPKGIIRDLKWKERQKVNVRRSGSKIIIEDWLPTRLKKKR
ncbi:hypothetical protein KJ885_01015 [Patescibacteria group bacterium]|nr:hypothetical protein [Patescibacteria group bacterium]